MKLHLEFELSIVREFWPIQY